MSSCPSEGSSLFKETTGRMEHSSSLTYPGICIYLLAPRPDSLTKLAPAHRARDFMEEEGKSSIIFLHLLAKKKY